MSDSQLGHTPPPTPEVGLIGRQVVSVNDDGDAPVIGTIVGWSDNGEICEVAWGDDRNVVYTWTDELTPYRRR